MTLLAAVAAGTEAVGSLKALVDARPADSVGFVQHLDLAVAWSNGSAWVDTFDDGEVLIVLDGRLHNLPTPTPTPTPTGQAETLRHLYRDKGTDIAVGLLGDFVLIVLDRSTRTLLVARDPLGVRPWYQASQGGRHAGATDLATLAALPWVDTSVDDKMAVLYLASVEDRGDGTFYRGITTLAPGSTWYSRDAKSATFAHHRWSLHADLDISWADAAQRCRETLDLAVACRLYPDMPATCELSGGLDSSAVVGTVAVLGRADLTAARVVFDTPRADERRFSDEVAAHWGIPLVSVGPWAPTQDEADALTRQLHRPLPPTNFTMVTGLDRVVAQQGRPLLLTGLGGDDAFVACSMGSRVTSAIKLHRGDILRRLARTTVSNPRRAWRQVHRPTLAYLAPWKGRAVPTWLTDRAVATADVKGLIRRRPQKVSGVAAIDERIAGITGGYDAAILEDVAAWSEVTGVRRTHPFLDPRFIEATYGLDPWWPTVGGHFRALQVEAFADRLPPLVAGRTTKAEFSEFCFTQVLQESTVEMVTSGIQVAEGWLDREGFAALVEKGRRGTASAADPLCRIVNMERWLASR